jgi:hypothetical protein
VRGPLEQESIHAGPLIHLAEADCLILLEIFRELHVPEAVWRLRLLASESSLFVTPAIVDLAIDRLRTGESGTR